MMKETQARPPEHPGSAVVCANEEYLSGSHSKQSTALFDQLVILRNDLREADSMETTSSQTELDEHS